MITAAQLVAKVMAEGADETKNQLQGVSDIADKASGRSGGGGLRGLLQAGLDLAGTLGVANLVAGGFNFLKDQIGSVFENATSQQQIATQTRQVLASTGEAAGISADQIGDYADKMARMTMFSDDAIQSSENVLLTFTQIGGSVFPKAQTAILDVSQAMGEDLQSATVQVGKALNDPVSGMTALQRIGVTFNQSQKDTIKTMMDTGNIAGAQGIILQELSKEFGGSAQAAGGTFAGQMKIAGNTMDQVKEKIGGVLMPALSGLAYTFLQNVMPAVQNFSDWFTNDAAPVLGWFAYQLEQNIGPALSKLGNFVTTVVVPALIGFANYIQVNILPTVEKFAGWIMEKVVPALIQMWNWFSANIMPILAQVAAIVVQTVFPALQSIGDVIINQLIPPVEGIIGKLAPYLIPAFRELGDIISTYVAPILSGVINVVAGIATGISTLIGWIQSVIGWFGSLGDKASQALQTVKTQVNNIPVIGGIANWAGFASGTDSVPQSGFYKVGERGEEIVYLPQGSTVVPNNALSSAPAYTGATMQGGHGATVQVYIDSNMIASAVLPALVGKVRLRAGIRSA